MRKKLALLLLTAFCLTACGEEPEPEPIIETPPLRQISEQETWDIYTFVQITPVTAFESSDEQLRIYPYNDSEKHITIEKFYTSGNGFFNTVLDQCSQENIQTGSSYILFTLPDGITHAIVNVDAETSIHVYSDLLSGYVAKVAEQIQ